MTKEEYKEIQRLARLVQKDIDDIHNKFISSPEEDLVVAKVDVENRVVTVSSDTLESFNYFKLLVNWITLFFGFLVSPIIGIVIAPITVAVSIYEGWNDIHILNTLRKGKTYIWKEWEWW
jgi:hypothetical protein